MVDSHKLRDEEKQEELEMGDYFSKLDTLTFDMGQLEEDEEAKAGGGGEQQSWKDWWHFKQIQNDKLKVAIIENNSNKVTELLTDENLAI